MRPKKNITPNIESLIEKLASYGLNNTEIAKSLEMDDNTLKRSYEKFLTKGRVNLKTRLKRKQIDVALKGNVPMLIWLGKQYLDQKDTSQETNEIKILLEKRELTSGSENRNQLP